MISVRGLHKRFGTTQALSGLDLDVAAGRVCGLLGPNGAGKTTAVRVLATLVRPDAGTARVAGHDVVTQAEAVRGAIGLAGQHAAVDEGLTGRDNLRLVGRFRHLGARPADRRADELLERHGLTAVADRPVRTYSGGQRRRLDLVASLVTSPPVLFLDEPTTGLDPRSRAGIWDTVRELTVEGTTVLLTTQYLEEADRLADEIVVVDRGRAVRSGRPAELKAAIGTRIEVTVAEAGQLTAAAELLAGLADGPPAVDADRRQIAATTRPGPGPALPDLVRALDAAGVVAVDVALRTPSLDDVFLALTAGDASRPVGGGDDRAEKTERAGRARFTDHADTAGSAQR